MTIALKYRETNSRGCFVAWGIGFNYEYDPDERILDISDARKNKPLLYIEFDHHTSRHPLLYTKILEKATQINALMLSNNQTVDLAEILSTNRLTALLKSSARLADYSYSLKRSSFKRFSDGFCSDFEFQRLKIKKVPSKNYGNNLYAAKLQTNNGHEAAATSVSIHGIMKELSERTVCDLMAIEYSQDRKAAHNLLNASANMSKVSRILDGQFSPHRQIAKYGNISGTDSGKQKSIF